MNQDYIVLAVFILVIIVILYYHNKTTSSFIPATPFAPDMYLNVDLKPYQIRENLHRYDESWTDLPYNIIEY